MLPMLEAEAKERQRAAGGDRKSEAAKSLVPETVQPIFNARLVEQAAEIVGIGKTSVQDIKAIAKEAPEKIQEIKEGKTTVGAVFIQASRSGAG